MKPLKPREVKKVTAAAYPEIAKRTYISVQEFQDDYRLTKQEANRILLHLYKTGQLCRKWVNDPTKKQGGMFIYWPHIPGGEAA